MERKLASIRKILDIKNIEGADKIEIVFVDGWKVVSEKGLYAVGDLVVYCEIDSWIPSEIAPFLSKGQTPKVYNGVKGERLKTIKLRGEISQGLLLPLKILSKYNKVWNEDDDVTDILNIQKWEAPIPACLSGKVKGIFPNEIPKTDEERIQNLSKNIDYLKNFEYFVSEKLDGSSCTFYFINDCFGVCSRNYDLYESSNNTLWNIARRYSLEEKMRIYSEQNKKMNFAIQGEIIGEGIQKNKYKIKGQEFFVFNVYDISSKNFLDDQKILEICKEFNINHVPILENNKNIISIEDILQFAQGKSNINKDIEREGVVFKTKNREVSFKAISNKFLQKEN